MSLSGVGALGLTDARRHGQTRSQIAPVPHAGGPFCGKGVAGLGLEFSHAFEQRIMI